VSCRYISFDSPLALYLTNERYQVRFDADDRSTIWLYEPDGRPVVFDERHVSLKQVELIPQAVVDHDDESRSLLRTMQAIKKALPGSVKQDFENLISILPAELRERLTLDDVHGEKAEHKVFSLDKTELNNAEQEFKRIPTRPGKQKSGGMFDGDADEELTIAS